MSVAETFQNVSGAIHFMGVAGEGMVSLAELMARHGLVVTGCDLQPDPASRFLSSWGVEILSGHDPAHVDDACALVMTSAVPQDHPEVERARSRGIPVMKRAEALGAWVQGKRVLAVAGTHGKTTTTAMATEILAAAGREPTGLVGGRVSAWGSNLRFGSDELYVVEADEYDRSFHHLTPSLAVLTNLEADHLDIYKDLNGVETAFRMFLDRLESNGTVVASGDDHGVSRLLPGLGGRVRTFGLEPGAQLRGINVRTEGEGMRFDVVELGEIMTDVRIRVPGLHNVRNALAAAGAARALEADWKAIRSGLERYEGVGRRFEILGDAGGVTVVDDYAHHPTEIRAALAAVRDRFPGRRVVALFQPHLFSRTRDFAKEFGAALATADVLWITEIYPAREEPIPGVSGVLVAQAALDAGAESVSFHPGLAKLPQEVVPTLRSGDVCITLGAGSIEFVGPDLLARLQSARERTGKGVRP